MFGSPATVGLADMLLEALTACASGKSGRTVIGLDAIGKGLDAATGGVDALVVVGFTSIETFRIAASLARQSGCVSARGPRGIVGGNLGAVSPRGPVGGWNGRPAAAGAPPRASGAAPAAAARGPVGSAELLPL